MSDSNQRIYKRIWRGRRSEKKGKTNRCSETKLNCDQTKPRLNDVTKLNPEPSPSTRRTWSER
jgi:hypothetical protein